MASYPISTIPEYPGDIAHDLGIVTEPLRHVCENCVAF